jgi:phage shock protein C
MHKRLIKGEQKIFGVCSGIGNYLDIDPTIIRVLFAVAAVCFGTGIFLYLILAVVMPSR